MTDVSDGPEHDIIGTTSLSARTVFGQLDFSGTWQRVLSVDIFLPNEDARQEFWPLSEDAFRSPVSYWDPDRDGSDAAPIEAALGVTLTLLLFWRRRRR